ncbi:UNVERIFIED_CONTAM: hypothetical protein FKN15_040560 [Acipenser sinensis]
MVGKARSANFTEAEKIDLLQLVRPHVRVIEEHKHKHSAIVEKNRCWDAVAEYYNALEGERPPRTAQGLRTLYKRLKENTKQELMQRQRAQPEYRQQLSEPTRRLLLMVPAFFQNLQNKENSCFHRFPSSQSSYREEPGYLSSQPTSSETRLPTLLAAPNTEVHSNEDAKLLGPHLTDSMEIGNEDPDNAVDSSASSCPSSVNMMVVLSPSCTSLSPQTNTLSRPPTGESLSQAATMHQLEALQLSKKDQELSIENHRKLGLYIELKREGLKRKQQLEEELLRAKIKVEKLRASRLKHGLPEFNSM